MELEVQRPRLSFRCTTLFGWFIPIFIIFSFFAFREPIPVDLLLLAVFSFVSVSIAVPGFVQVVRLQRKKESKFVTIIFSLVSLIAVIGLLEMKERGIFVWNELYLTVPFLVFSLVTFAGCFYEEDRHTVRVYRALDGFRFVRV